MSEVSRFNSYGRAEFSADGSLVDYWEHKCLVDKKDSQIKDLEKQLAEAKEEIRKAFDWALDITDEDFNSRDEVGNNNNKVKQILWEEYKEKVK